MKAVIGLPQSGPCLWLLRVERQRFRIVPLGELLEEEFGEEFPVVEIPE